MDFNLNAKNKLFGRIQEDRFQRRSDCSAISRRSRSLVSSIDHSRSWVVGETWTISNNLINQAFGGLTRQLIDFPVNFAPTAPNLITPSLIASPYGDIRGQGRNVAVPEFRDDLSYIHGKHTLTFGTDIKPIRVNSSNQSDINFVDIDWAAISLRWIPRRVRRIFPAIRPRKPSGTMRFRCCWGDTARQLRRLRTTSLAPPYRRTPRRKGTFITTSTSFMGRTAGEFVRI